MATLPTPGAFLTSLLNTLTSPSSTSPSTSTTQPRPETTNPLQSLPHSQRALLTTMHVIFPPPMLLQSLDLLDRGLVTRIVLHKEETGGIEKDTRSEAGSENNDKEEENERVKPPQAGIHLSSSPRAEPPALSPHIYQVRSSQSKPRFRRSAASAATYAYANASAERSYIVRLASWNCSCAAFVFSAFPCLPSFSPSSVAPYSISSEGGREGKDIEGEEGGWEFGGLSFDSKDGQGVPVCKHLLAGLLAEKWGLLGGYVTVREVGREEMAGLGVEG